ncbi:MAG: polysaccharide biosynthesis protein [Bacteroidales bacterium]|nr:polysaccharide biosynthesis protein [Bacteroidales bacterium]
MNIDTGNLQLWLSKKALKLFRKYSLPRWIVFLHDNLAVFVTLLLAYILRFNFFIHDFDMNLAMQHAIAVFCIYCVFSLIFRPYSGMIRHTTIIDIFYVFITTTMSAVVATSLSLVSRNTEWLNIISVPLSIIIIHYFLITVYLFAVRITVKTLYHLTASLHNKKKKVLIYGAGALGVIVKRLLLSDIKGEYQVAGFLDNNKNLQGKKLNGIHVYSPHSITKEFLHKHDIGTMIFAIRDISPTEKSEIIRSALDLGLEVRDVPAVETWLNGELQMKQIQKVKLEDLLGREPIELNLKRIGLGLRGKTILVTGAAGSIGSEIVRQLTRFPVKTIVLVDQAETPMFHLQNELRSGYSECPVEIILADATLIYKMENIFKEFKPEIVFHAAAYKHVPLMEENPHEAIRVNVGGTKLITKLAVEYGVEKFVMISSDKAVNPTNIMGASKRLCETVVQLQSQNPSNKTQFIITRFGNVLGSNGSVIPLFEKQIADGGPVTVTHHEVTRYFMTIPEACQLVLEAGFMGKGGEIFVFDMGNPVKIVDLAFQMIRLSGFVPEKDIKVVFIGLRPGEKLFEELLTDKENTLPTHHPKINIARVESFNRKEKLSLIDSLLGELYKLSKYEIVLKLRQLVPEYLTNNQEFLTHGNKEINLTTEKSIVKSRKPKIHQVMKRLMN